MGWTREEEGAGSRMTVRRHCDELELRRQMGKKLQQL